MTDVIVQHLITEQKGSFEYSFNFNLVIISTCVSVQEYKMPLCGKLYYAFLCHESFCLKQCFMYVQVSFKVFFTSLMGGKNIILPILHFYVVNKEMHYA